MNTKRVLLFLIGCMGSRLGFTWLAYSTPKLLFPLGIVGLTIASGFMYIWYNGLRKTGPETFGQPIWWDHLRPVHALLWAIFSLMALNGMYEHAWKVLLADTTLGFTAWLNNTFIK